MRKPIDPSVTPKPPAAILARAAAARAAQIQTIAACTCDWPIVMRRNRHGHADNCPAVAVWQQHQNAIT